MGKPLTVAPAEAGIIGLSFEQAYGRLEQAVSALEGGNLTLERAIELFEQGTRLVQHCNSMLDTAELRVRQLAYRDESAVPVEL